MVDVMTEHQQFDAKPSIKKLKLISGENLINCEATSRG
jgi:hypothetical protein